MEVWINWRRAEWIDVDWNEAMLHYHQIIDLFSSISAKRSEMNNTKYKSKKEGKIMEWKSKLIQCDLSGAGVLCGNVQQYITILR